MPKSKIKVEDIISLIEKHARKGYVDADILLSYIDKNKTTKPEIKLPVKKRKEVYNISDHIQAINKYQNNIKTGSGKSYLCSYFENHFQINILKDKSLRVYPIEKEMWIKDENGIRTFIPNAYYNRTFHNYDFVTTEKELMEILNISKGTVNTWKNKGIITQYNFRIRVEVDGKNYKYRNTWLKCYDLEYIKENLSSLK